MSSVVPLTCERKFLLNSNTPNARPHFIEWDGKWIRDFSGLGLRISCVEGGGLLNGYFTNAIAVSFSSCGIVILFFGFVFDDENTAFV